MARILLVDDDRDIRKLGITLLAAEGHEAIAADSAESAMEFLEKHPFDMIITDANMPTASGFDLVKKLKSDERFDHLTIAMLTGRRERRDIERALELGVHGYIVKPMDPMIFARKIEELLGSNPQHDQAQHDLDLASLTLTTKARVSMEVEMLSLSEMGVLVRSTHRLPENSRIELSTDLFKQIGIEPPVLRVVTSVERERGAWETRLSFMGADDRVLSRIRAWIHSNTARNAKRGSRAA